MISDILSDALDAIGSYREHPGTIDCYSDPKLALELDYMEAVMEDMRRKLDAPPTITGGVSSHRPWKGGE